MNQNYRALSFIAALSIMLLALFITTPAAFAENPPEGEPPRDFSLPAVERVTLDNGMKITLVPFGKIPKAVVRVDVRTGNLNEGSNTWLSDLAGELMKEGTQVRSAELIARQTARMGGQLGIATGVDQTYVSLSVLSEFVSDAVSIVAETLQQPAMPESELDRLRGNLQRSLSLARNQPQSIAASAFAALLYPDHPYGAFPTDEQLNSYTHSDVVNYFKNNFGAQRSHILVAGKFDKNQVMTAIKKEFGGWKRGPEVLIDLPETPKGLRIKLIDRPDAPQSNVLIGMPVMEVAHPDFSGFVQMNTLLGGYFSSRITANIREDKGYTYSPRGRVSANYRRAYWQQSAAITTEHTGAAINEIFKEIARMRDENPEPEEISRTQNYLTGTFVLSHATPAGLLNRLSYMNLHNLPNDYLEKYLSNINSLKAKDYRSLAQEYLIPEQMTVVIVGDLSKVRPQLEAVPALANAKTL